MRSPNELLRRLNPVGSPKLSMRVPRHWTAQERRACCLACLGQSMLWACQGGLHEGRTFLRLADKLAGADTHLQRECFARQLSFLGLEGRWSLAINQIRQRLPQVSREMRDNLEFALSQALRADGQLEEALRVLRGYRNRLRRRGDTGMADYVNLFIAADLYRLGRVKRAESLLRKLSTSIYPPPWPVEIEMEWIRQGVQSLLPASAFLTLFQKLEPRQLLEWMVTPDDEQRPIHTVALLPARACLLYTRLVGLGGRVREAELPGLLPLVLQLLERVRAQVGYSYDRAEILRSLGSQRESQEEYWRALAACEWLDGKTLSAKMAFLSGFRWLGSSSYQLLEWSGQKRRVEFAPPRLALDVLSNPALKGEGARLASWVANPLPRASAQTTPLRSTSSTKV